MNKTPTTTNMFFSINSIDNLELFDMHLNAAVRDCERNLSFKINPNPEGFRGVKIPRRFIRININDNRVNISFRSICDIESQKCFIVDNKNKKHELSFRDSAKEIF